jgi:hypothetical protein
VCLCMIVRDESAVIERLVNSVRGLILSRGGRCENAPDRDGRLTLSPGQPCEVTE